jgi:hypothetical protein
LRAYDKKPLPGTHAINLVAAGMIVMSDLFVIEAFKLAKTALANFDFFPIVFNLHWKLPACCCHRKILFDLSTVILGHFLNDLPLTHT